MFDTLTARLNSAFSSLRSRGRLDEKAIDGTLREVRLALLEADVAVPVAKALLARVKDKAMAEEVRKSLTPSQQVIKIVHDELVTTLGGTAAELAKPSSPPLVILMVGLQGSGKTTTAAKLAKKLKGEGRRPLLVAADLQRPAAIDQLETLGDRIGVPVYTDRGAKPPRLVKASLKEAKKGSHDSVIVDTAGRLQIDTELMEELAAVRKAADPDEVLLVVDAMTGQDAINVAKGFLDHTDLTGLVLSKLDGDARGGAAISAGEVTGRPIKFAGLGESLDDLEQFHPDRMASRILGMGDVMTLIEKAEASWDVAEAEAAAAKLADASFDLEDFLVQFQQLRKLGPVNQLVGMLPGAPAGDIEVSERDLARVEAIIRSMTIDERRSPKMIDGSRRRRIAKGSGTSTQEVNRLLKQYGEAKKMMKSLAAGTGPLAAMLGGGRKRKKTR
jgi:signal recognition particle subunit SRP54